MQLGWEVHTFLDEALHQYAQLLPQILSHAQEYAIELLGEKSWHEENNLSEKIRFM